LIFVVFEPLQKKLARFRAANREARWQMVIRALWYFSLYRPAVALATLLRPVVEPLLRRLRPHPRLRFGLLRHDRIGHLALNTELLLRRQRREGRSSKERVVLLSKGPPANYQLLQMITRRITVRRSEALADALRVALCNSPVWADLPMYTNEYPEWNNLDTELAFTAEEEQRGHALLASMGIEPGSPFVCFHARDARYLETVQKDQAGGWRYHDYRDCQIENYLPSANFLAAQGIVAIRMGHLVQSTLPNPRSARIIDYANDCRSDFGDVYLPARCKFFLGNTAGLCLLPSVFKRPCAAANSIGHIPLLESDLFIVKKLWHIADRRFLRFGEVIELGADEWLRSERYAHAGLEVVENTADEILDLTKEINDRIDGVWVANEEDEEMQRRYRALFPPGHRCYGFPCRIGAAFLRQHRALL